MPQMVWMGSKGIGGSKAGAGTPPITFGPGDALLLEIGDFILLESGDKILIDF